MRLLKLYQAFAVVFACASMAVAAGSNSSPAAGARTAAPAAQSSAVGPAPRADFSGRWKLLLERSVMGKLPGVPKARTDSIQQGAQEIVQTLYLVLPTGPDTTVYRYRPDADPTVNRVGEQDITSTVTWEPDALRLRSKTKLLMFDMTLDERWRLSPKRDSLIMTRTVKYPMGEGQQRLVFVKE